MANPNFFFTDPVAAQQAVQMAQLENAARESLRRNAVDNIRTFGQRDIARENSSQQRAITQAQLAQRDREMMQQDRQFGELQGYRKDALNADRDRNDRLDKWRREDAQLREKTALEDEQFSLVESEINSQNPPTFAEFDARTQGMTPQRKDALNRLRLNRIAEMGRMANVAENTAANWNKQLERLAPDDPKRERVVRDFQDSKDRSYIELDLSTGRFRSLIPRPRSDAQPDALGGVPSITPIAELSRRVRGTIGLAPSVPAPAPVSMYDLLGNVSQNALQGYVPPEPPMVQPNYIMSPMGATPPPTVLPPPPPDDPNFWYR